MDLMPEARKPALGAMLEVKIGGLYDVLIWEFIFQDWLGLVRKDFLLNKILIIIKNFNFGYTKKFYKESYLLSKNRIFLFQILIIKIFIIMQPLKDLKANQNH